MKTSRQMDRYLAFKLKEAEKWEADGFLDFTYVACWEGTIDKVADFLCNQGFKVTIANPNGLIELTRITINDLCLSNPF